MRIAAHPFDQFLLKVHSRCDLACDYCYVYTKADHRWATRPIVMEPAVVERAAARIAEHARAHRLPSVGVLFHGGEPLLAGPARTERYVHALRTAVEPVTRLELGMQTNAVLLTRQRIARLRDLGVRIGVSLDGGREAHDRHRRHRDGRGSHDRVAAALTELARPENAPVYAGLLCTVDLHNDPVAVYEDLLAHRPPRIDFLLPEGNWSSPPPGRDGSAGATPYADWLIAVFDRWYADDRPPGIRFFDDVVNVLLGGRPTVSGLGIAPITSVVVETDGSIEVCDALTDTYDHAAVTGLAVGGHSFDDALGHPLVRERQAGLAALAPACRACDLATVCGGGVHGQRFRAGHGFANPSVYCADLYRLIHHIRAVLVRDLARESFTTAAGPASNAPFR